LYLSVAALVVVLAAFSFCVCQTGWGKRWYNKDGYDVPKRSEYTLLATTYGSTL